MILITSLFSLLPEIEDGDDDGNINNNNANYNIYDKEYRNDSEKIYLGNNDNKNSDNNHT